MAIEKVIEYLRAYGLEDRVRRFSVSSATVALAAQALGVEEARIAKTMSSSGGGAGDPCGGRGRRARG